MHIERPSLRAERGKFLAFEDRGTDSTQVEDTSECETAGAGSNHGDAGFVHGSLLGGSLPEPLCVGFQIEIPD